MDKVIEMYNTEIPLNEICNKLKISVSELFNYLEESVEGFFYKGPRSFQQAHIKTILIQYVDLGKGVKLIAKEFRHCSKTVSSIIQGNNIQITKGKLTDSDKNQIIAMKVSQGMKTKDIAEHFGVSTSCILSVLKENKIPLEPYRPTVESQISARKHHFNTRFFQVIDTEGKAYYLLLFVTDGYFLKRDKKLMGIGISQKKSSAPILQRFLDEVGSDGSLREASYLYKKTKRLYSKAADLSSKEMAEDVRIQLNLPMGNFYKTFDVTCPKNIPEFLESHACRAALDGDGTINYDPTEDTNKNEKDMYVSIYGTHALLEGLREIICRNCGVSFISIKEKKRNPSNEYENQNHLYELSWSGRVQVLKILDWMYKDATIYLESKYQKYKSIDRRKRIIDLAEIVDGPSVTSKRKELGVSQDRLAKILSCSQAVISDFENEKRTKMSAEIARKLLEFFNIEYKEEIFFY